MFLVSLAEGFIHLFQAAGKIFGTVANSRW